MSGRVVTTRPSGKRVRGYCKTDREIAHRRAAHEMPEWRLTLPLPGSLAFSISSDHPTGVIGTAVTKSSDGAPQIEATGKDWQWVFAQAAILLSRFGAGILHNGQRLTATITRDAYPGPTQSAPMRPAIKESRDFIVVTQPSIVVPRAFDNPLVFPVKL